MQAVFLNYDEALQDEAVGDLPVLPIPVTYPAYGSAALLPLQGPDYRAEARPLLDMMSAGMTADGFEAVCLLWTALTESRQSAAVHAPLSTHCKQLCSCLHPR